jgi:hypothetical protein
MSNPMQFLPGFEGIATPAPDNALWNYLQKQSPEVFQEVTQSSSPEVLEVLAYNIRSLLGSLPGDQFGVQIVTNRENLARLISGAMMGGYFLRVMEQRHQLERTLTDTDTQTQSQNTAQ